MNLQRFVRRLPRIFRRSIQLRAVAATVGFSAIALVLLGGFLSYSIGTGLYQTRLNQILSESERAVLEVQNTFAAATGTDEITLQRLVNAVVPNLETTGLADTRKVAMLRSPGQVTAVVLQSPISAELDTAVISDRIREDVGQNLTQLSYQSVALTDSAGTRHPGVVVGALVNIPVAGDYELYLVFNLAGEQQTLDLVQATLVVGGLVTMLIIAMISWFVTRQIVRPVQEIARVAREISSGALELQLNESGEDAVAGLARSFNEMTGTLREQIAKLKRLSTMQQRFVSDVSHELRTPLTTIKLAGDFIFSQRDNFEQPLRRSIDLLHSHIENFERLLSDLLEISRYDAQAVTADIEPQDLNGVVGRAIQSIEPLANSKGSRLLVELPSGSVIAELDAPRIERLLRNLLANAVEHGGGKPVLVCVAGSDEAVAVSVTDFGVGMTEEQLKLVFDRFWRADPARKRTTGGTGLGLAISIEDAALHNGWLQVWASPGRGACFRLTLPRVHSKNFSQSPLPMPPRELRRETRRALEAAGIERDEVDRG